MNWKKELKDLKDQIKNLNNSSVIKKENFNL